MELTISIIIAILTAAAIFASSIKYVHIFQLNSYAHDTQRRWLYHNFTKLLPNIIFGALSAGLYLFKPYLAIIPLVIAIIFNRYKKAKKPIAFTARVKRLILTVMLISVIIPAVICVFSVKAGITAGMIIYIFNPIIILIADTINSPIEKGIKNYYINDAMQMIENSNAQVIGITGSYGKTSLKYYLNTLMNAQYDTLMTPESFNTPMGVVITVRSNLSARHKYFICEMGARRVGDIKEICDIVNPKFAVITSIGPQHLETFKNIENVIKTKFELADALPENAPLFLNFDNKYIRQTAPRYEKTRNIISYGKTDDVDYKYEILSVGVTGTTFKIKTKNEEYTYTTKLIGEHNVLNITGAVAASNTLGISLEKLALPIKRLECVPHRLELKDNGQAIIIDDAYNSNPSGAKAALDTLALFDDYKILITPGMVELGDRQYECNKTFGEQASKVCDYIILVGKAQAEPIIDGMFLFPKERYFVADTVNEAITHAYSLHTAGKKKVILLENDLPDNYLK